MKQSMKNLIMIGMAVVLVGTSAITLRYASDGMGHMTQVDGRPQFEQRGDFDNQNGGGLQNFGGGQKNNNSQNENQNDSQQQAPPNGNNQTPPNSSDKQFGGRQTPNNDQQNGENDKSGSEQAPSDNNSTDSKGEGKTDENSANQKNTASDSSELSFVSTAVQNNQSSGDEQNATAMQGMRGRGVELRIAEKVICYIFAAVQIGIIVLILLYLAFSEFNKLTYKQTAAKFKKNKNTDPV